MKTSLFIVLGMVLISSCSTHPKRVPAPRDEGSSSSYLGYGPGLNAQKLSDDEVPSSLKKTLPPEKQIPRKRRGMPTPQEILDKGQNP